jgi:hypothetical protein
MGIDVGEDSIWSPRQHQSPFVSHVTADIWATVYPSSCLDIELPENPFDYREDQNTETTEELLAMVRLEGSVGFQAKLRKLCEEYIDVFSTRVRHQSAKVEPMSIVVDRGKWEVSRNRLPPRHYNSDKLMPCFAMVSSRSVMHLHGAKYI